MNNFQTKTFKVGKVSLDVKVSVEDGTIWLSAMDMAKLFNVNVTTVRRNINLTHKSSIDDTDDKDAAKMHFCTYLSNSKRSLIYDESVILELARRYNYPSINLLNAFIEKQKATYIKKDVQDENSECIVYNNGEISINVNVSPEDETVWLTQNQIATLFGTTQPNVSMHISNILNESELDDSVHKDFLYTASNSRQYLTTVYNLDLILAVGYRIKGKRAIEFRKWVTSVLKHYLVEGYAISENRLSIYSDKILNLENEIEKIKNDTEQLKADILKGNIKERVFFEGEMLDAYEYFCSLVRRADSNIRIVDPYFDDRGLLILSKSKDINRTVYLSQKSSLDKREIKLFRKDYGNLDVKCINNFHDRFIIIDDKECYLIGTSLNHAGSKIFAIMKLEERQIINELINRLKE